MEVVVSLTVAATVNFNVYGWVQERVLREARLIVEQKTEFIKALKVREGGWVSI